MANDVALRVSAYEIGDRANPRHVWGVGVPVDIVNSLPEDQRRVTLEAKDGKFFVKLSDQGISLSLPNPNAPTMWTTQIGLHHCKGIDAPSEVVRAKKVPGTWRPRLQKIEVKNPPAFIHEAMDHVTPAPDDDVPSTHFTEDVQAAAMANATGPSNFILDEDDSEAQTPTQIWLDEQLDKASGEVFSEVVELTPELADLLLQRNAGNRNIRPTKLNQYVSDIVNDRWQLNGEAIMVSKDGFMNNGQHRCSAVIAANKSIKTFMVFGVERETRATVDTGASRTAGDYLSLQGYKYSAALAGITRYVIAYERNDKQSLSYLSSITVSEILDRVEGDELLKEAASFTGHSSKIRRLATPSVIGFVYYTLSQIDADDAKAYLESTITGIGLQADSPQYVIREKLLNMPDLGKEQKIECFFRGWNAFRKQKPMKAIRIMWELPELV